MAVQSVLSNKKLILSTKTGVDATGKDVIKTVTFTKITPLATDDQIYNTAAAIGPLFTNGLSMIEKSELHVITNA